MLEHIIKGLEERLLHSDVRANPDILNELLAEDFEELGSIGKISSRNEVVDWLVNKERGIRWSLTDFRVRQLSSDLVLAIYRAQKHGLTPSLSKESMRSSIWKLYGTQWKMVFHQGTKIEGE